MKVLHVIPSLSPSQGGPSFALPLMARALATQGIDVDVATTDDDGARRHVDGPRGEFLEADGHRLIRFRKQTEFYKVSLPLGRWLSRHAHNYSLVHIHALFSYAPVSAALKAHAQQVPYVVRPLGVLNRWGMRNRRSVFKRISMRLFEGRILRHASAIHYTSLQEQVEAEGLGVPRIGRIIPLGIDLTPLRERPDPTEFLARFPETRESKRILFLSRIDPKKGLDLLLPAFREVLQRIPDCRLILAGTADPAYEACLRSEAARLGLSDRLVWTGFLSGSLKYSALGAASVFVLPSHSENFGIAAVESIAAGTPTVLTPGVAIAAEAAQQEAAIMASPDPGSIARDLTALLLDPVASQQLGLRGREFAFREYSAESMGQRLAALYVSMGRKSV